MSSNFEGACASKCTPISSIFNPIGGEPNPGNTDRRNASSNVTTRDLGHRANTRRDIGIRPQTPTLRPRTPSHPFENEYPAARITRRNGHENNNPAENPARRSFPDLFKEVSSPVNRRIKCNRRVQTTDNGAQQCAPFHVWRLGHINCVFVANGEFTCHKHTGLRR